ncbi:MAG: glycosyltransferase family 2 protein [Bacteroidota bacterium]
MNPKVSVIIVNWNTKPELERCLHALTGTEKSPGFEVIVADNSSDDGSVQMARSQFPGVVVLENERNCGFAGGVNMGMRNSHAPYILILNPDVALQKGVIGNLVEILESVPEAAAVSPRFLDEGGRPQTGYFRKLPSVGQILFFHTMLEKVSSRIPWFVNTWLEEVWDISTGPREVAQLPGACMLVRKDVLDIVGPMDERFFLFFEDVDWSFRMKAAGWKLMASDDEVLHSGGRSFEYTTSAWKFARFLLSLNMYMEKNGSPMQKVLSSFLTMGNSYLALFLRSMQKFVDSGEAREYAEQRIDAHRMFLRAMRNNASLGAPSGDKS